MSEKRLIYWVLGCLGDAALVIAMVMMVAMVVPAMAADPAQTGLQITITSEYPNHTFTAYQIFAGKVDSNDVTAGTTKLADIEWATGVNTSGLISALYTIPSVKAAMVTMVTTINNNKAPGAEFITYAGLNAAQVANCISGVTDTAELNKLAKALADNKGTVSATSTEITSPYTITGLAAGYYVVIDNGNSSAGAANDADSAYMVNLVGNTAMTVKTSKPSSDKTVSDDADSGTADDLTGDSKPTSAAAGTTYESADHALYETFKYTITAKLPNDAELDAYLTYKLVFHDTLSKGLSFLGIDSVKIGNTDIPVENAEKTNNGYILSENVASASASSPVDADVTNGLAWSLTIPDLIKFDSSIKGKTVTVVYNAYLNKDALVSSVAAGTSTNSNDNTMYIEYQNNPYSTADTSSTTPDTVHVFTYDMPNTKYANQIDAAHVLAGAKFSVTGPDGAISFIPVGTDGKTLAIGADIKAYRVAKSGEEGIVTEVTSLTDGTFKLLGLDAGSYTLHETVVPAGFNAVPDATIVITGNTEETSSGALATMTMTMNGTASTTNNLVDSSDTTLPSTGGIGTTIFYVIGAILVLGAGILLVTRRRVSAN